MAQESWKTAYRSFYYEQAPIPDDLELDAAKTALLVIDMQNTYLTESEVAVERERWAPFMVRMHETVIPNIQRLIHASRAKGMDVLFARIACQTPDGRDRSLSQRKPGFNNLLLPKNDWESQVIDALAPKSEEIVVLKTTDSALTGTNLRLTLSNLGIEHVICVGIFTDQCVSSTVRSLADESFDVIVCHDACAAATDALHDNELKTINWIYCQVASTNETLNFIR
jgi:nicotinamidase-related amidase